MNWTILVWFMLGAFAEALFYTAIQQIRSTKGYLRIDHTNPDKDIYRVEIPDLDVLTHKKYVELKIDHNADLSQK